MAMSYYVEVDVNGEEVFWVDKRILSSFSGKFNKLFSKPYVTSEVKSLKVILHGLPGGAEAFELVARFCYNKGKVQMNPANTYLLHYASRFMEMGGNTESFPNLVEHTEKSLKVIACWTWSELLIALKQCHSHCLSESLLDKLMDSVVERVASTNGTSPSNSSESSGFRCSFDTRSTMSRKQSSQRAWWFEDLVLLNLDIIERIVKMMLSRKVDHGALSRFLLYCLKTKMTNRTSDDEKRKTVEVVIDLLFSLERTSISYRGLFTILQTSSSLNVRPCIRRKLNVMIGSQLDRANLDNILVPAPVGMDSLYDVGLVLRFCRSFLRELDGRSTSSTRLKMVANLMDLYLAEVAPDPSLKPQKFVSLAMVLPDEARVSYDGVYRAVDMYIEVHHAGLSEEARMRVCCALNYEKLSLETCKHLAQNSKLPYRTVIQALVSQQCKLKTLLQDNTKNHIFLKVSTGKSEDEKLQAHLQGMQWKVFELEKMCRKMQTQMTKIVKTGISSSKSSSRSLRSLPMLCS